MPKLRIAAAGGAVVLAVGIFTSGCAGDAGPVEVPTQHDVTGPLAAPTPADAAQWADAVIPDNAPGGTDYLAREAGVLEPGAEPIIVLDGAEGTSTVTIACTTRAASALDYAVVSGGAEVDAGTVDCAPVGDPAVTHAVSSVPAGATVTLAAEASGLFVYAVSPETDPAT